MNFKFLFCAAITLFASCSKDSNDIDEGTFYCKIDGTPFKSNGNALNGFIYGPGFYIVATEPLDFNDPSKILMNRSVTLNIWYPTSGRIDLGDSFNSENFGSVMTSFIPGIPTEFETTFNSGYVNVYYNDGKVAKGNFNMNVTNGSRTIKVTEGKFHVRYLK